MVSAAIWRMVRCGRVASPSLLQY